MTLSTALQAPLHPGARPPHRPLTVPELREISRRARAQIVATIAHAEGGHLGGPLSAIDILCVLYGNVLRVRPEEPDWPDRDRFVLSKGHSSIALYTTLALAGYFSIAELRTFDAIDSRLQGHPDMTVLPGLDMSTGSLGLGFSAAVGMAVGARMAERDFRTYVMVGDGECNEGIVWEGAHVAARYALDNLIVIVDQNRLQQHGWLDSATHTRRPPYEGTGLSDRWAAFGWRVLEVDGHDVAALLHVLDEAARPTGRPTVVVSQTVKGKGVSFMENQPAWHSRVPDADQLAAALAELDAHLQN